MGRRARLPRVCSAALENGQPLTNEGYRVKLLTIGNPKTVKGEKRGYRTKGRAKLDGSGFVRDVDASPVDATLRGDLVQIAGRASVGASLVSILFETYWAGMLAALIAGFVYVVAGAPGRVSVPPAADDDGLPSGDWKACAAPQCRAPMFGATRRKYCSDACKRNAAYLRARDSDSAQGALTDTGDDIPF
jgi:hypothetical protein